MPHEVQVRAANRIGSDRIAVRAVSAVYRPRTSAAGGWVVVNPDFAPAFAAVGLDSAAAFLDLPGEVVSGHPDRHVLRVEVYGCSFAFYLKRQHVVRWREKWRNWKHGFGWISRSEREAALLERLTAAGMPCPRWAAVGRDGQGRAFLLVEEVPDAVDLRQFLSDIALTESERTQLARELGRTILAIHDAGFATPELAAKHILVSRRDGMITLIDWQLARSEARGVRLLERMYALAVLQASVTPGLASSRERFQVLREALKSPDLIHRQQSFFGKAARVVMDYAARMANRRSLRDQRHGGAAVRQRLVWVAGEQVCAVPEIAAIWPKPAVAAPYYGGEPGTFPLQLPDGSEAVLVRGRSFEPWARLKAWVRGRAWRSPGAALARLLFHLERYGIPAPKLLAFGQRPTGVASAEWFVVHTPAAAPVENDGPEAAACIEKLLRQLHDAGCRTEGCPIDVFGARDGEISVRDVQRVRLA